MSTSSAKQSKIVFDALAADPSGIDASALFRATLSAFGGYERFAAEIYREYRQGKAGGLTRQRIIEMMSRLCVAVTNSDLAKPKDLSEMSDAEIVTAMEGFLSKRSTAPDA